MLMFTKDYNSTSLQLCTIVYKWTKGRGPMLLDDWAWGYTTKINRDNYQYMSDYVNHWWIGNTFVVFLFQMVLLPATWFNRDCFLFTDLWWTPNCPRIGLRENLLEWPLLQCYKIRGFPFNAPFSSTYWFRDQTRPATRFPPWRGRKRKRSWSPSAPTWPRWTRRPSKPCSRQGDRVFGGAAGIPRLKIDGKWWIIHFEGDACPEMVDYYPKNPKFSWWNQLIGTSLSHSFPIIFP